MALPMAEARGFSRPAGEAHRASAPAPAGSALRDGSAPPEADDGCGGGMVRRASHEATAASSIAQTQEAALSPRLKPGACAPQEKVNPTTVGRLRPPSGVKTDALDARLLARIGRTDWPALRGVQPDEPLLQELKTLPRDLAGVLREQTRVVNQLTACLTAYYPVALPCFDGLTRQVTLAFLKAFPTPEAAAAASLEHLRSTSVRCWPRCMTRMPARRRSNWSRSCRRRSCTPQRGGARQSTAHGGAARPVGAADDADCRL